MTKQITDQMIREAAYYLWEKAGKPAGNGEKFWLKACQELYSKTQTPKITKKKKTNKK